MIRTAETTLGVELPTEYIELLRVQNGGYTKGFGYPCEGTSWAPDHVPLDDLAGIVLDLTHNTAMNLMESPDLSQEWGLPPDQLLLTGDGHWWITLDYRGGGEPCITWIDTEAREGIEEVFLAPNFRTFLEGLRPADSFDD